MVCYLGYMLWVGFVEEILFRGLLFKAIAKDNVKLAIIISSVTFGLGHLINMFKGAIAVGLLFVTIFYRGGSIWPCIITHSAIDMVSAFARMEGLRAEKRILFSVINFLIVAAYTIILTRTLPKKKL